MHLGVVKVGLLRLANLEVICQRIIFTTTKNSMLDRTLPTPNIATLHINFRIGKIIQFDVKIFGGFSAKLSVSLF